MVLPTAGEDVGRYRLDRVLGRGGMGVVYVATDPLLQRQVAVKVMTESVARDATFRARFAREAAVLARLDSPHVVAIHDHGEHPGPGGSPYLVTQLVPGGDLGTVLADRGTLPPPVAVRLLAQVAGALRDAHRVGVVHRDVKPANVLLRDAGALDGDDLHAYLCDFGIAHTEADGLTKTGYVAGSWKYLAPERGRGEHGSPASDVYSAGCLLWTCLTGRAPYDGSDVEVAIAHQREPVPQLPPGPGADALNRVLARALAKDPADRYADAAGLRSDLLALDVPDELDTLPDAPATGGTTIRTATPSGTPSGSPAAPPDLTPVQPTPTPRRRRAPALVAALAVVALGAGATVAGVLVADDPGGDADPSAGGGPADTAGGVTGDVDGDGLGDLALVDYPVDSAPRMTTYRSVGDGLDLLDTRPLREAAAAPLRADVDGDGVEEYVELARGAEPGTLDLREFDGGRTWQVTGVGDGAAPIVGDYDGDGVDDLALLGTTPAGPTGTEPVVELRIAWGSDAAVWEAETVATGAWDPLTDLVVPGDLDGDGADDLTLVRPQGVRGGVPDAATFTPLLTDGRDLEPGSESGLLLDASGALVRTVDDGSGRDSVLVVPRTGGRDVRMLTLDGDALVTGDPWATVGGSTEPESVATAGVTDVDGDGRDDLVLVRAVAEIPAAVEVVLAADAPTTEASFTAPLAPGALTDRVRVLDGAVNRPYPD